MAQESNIDPDVPADNEKAVKSELRANFQAAKDELDKLFRQTGLAWKIAFGDRTV